MSQRATRIGILRTTNIQMTALSSIAF